MNTVAPLFGGPAPGVADQEIVEILERALERASRGEIMALVMCELDPASKALAIYCGRNKDLAFAHMYLHAKLLTETS